MNTRGSEAPDFSKEKWRPLFFSAVRRSLTPRVVKGKIDVRHSMLKRSLRVYLI